MGSLYRRRWKDRDGTVHGSEILWRKHRQAGRVVRESPGTTNEVVARRMLRVREGDVEKGIPIVRRWDALAGVAPLWLTEQDRRTLRRNTSIRYLLRLPVFTPS
jgi:hypothetical protein